MNHFLPFFRKTLNREKRTSFVFWRGRRRVSTFAGRKRRKGDISLGQVGVKALWVARAVGTMCSPVLDNRSSVLGRHLEDSKLNSKLWEAMSWPLALTDVVKDRVPTGGMECKRRAIILPGVVWACTIGQWQHP